MTPADAPDPVLHLRTVLLELGAAGAYTVSMV